MKPILGLEASVRDDMAALRKDRRIKPSISIYGLIIDTSTGRLREVCSDVGASGGGEAWRHQKNGLQPKPKKLNQNIGYYKIMELLGSNRPASPPTQKKEYSNQQTTKILHK